MSKQSVLKSPVTPEVKQPVDLLKEARKRLESIIIHSKLPNGLAVQLEDLSGFLYNALKLTVGNNLPAGIDTVEGLKSRIKDLELKLKQKAEVNKYVVDYCHNFEMEIPEDWCYPGDLIYDRALNSFFICGDNPKDLAEVRRRNSSYVRIDVKLISEKLTSPEVKNLPATSKRLIFVGVHNKPGMTPLDPTSKSGKLITRCVNAIDPLGFEILRSNLWDLDELPESKESSQEICYKWATRVRWSTRDIVVILGGTVLKHFSKTGIPFIKMNHPADPWSKEDQDNYVTMFKERLLDYLNNKYERG